MALNCADAQQHLEEYEKNVVLFHKNVRISMTDPQLIADESVFVAGFAVISYEDALFLEAIFRSGNYISLGSQFRSENLCLAMLMLF